MRGAPHLFSAFTFAIGDFGNADENPFPAGRARYASCVERADDLNAPGDPRHTHHVIEAEAAIGHEAVNVTVGRRLRALDEGCDDFMVAGRHLHGNVGKPRHDLGFAWRTTAVDGHQIFHAAELETKDLRTIDQQDKGLPGFECARHSS